MNKIEEYGASKGRVHFLLTGADGEAKYADELDNLIVQVGHNFMANALINSSASPFTYMAVGTSSIPAASSDTTLGAELVRATFTSSVLSTNVVTLIWTLAAGVGTGALTEAGIFNASSAGILLSHIVFAVINKGASDTLTITWTITCN